MCPERPDEYQTAVQLLKLIEVDYSRTRKELQSMSRHFAEREASVVNNLRTALDALEHGGLSHDGVHGTHALPKLSPDKQKTESGTTGHTSMPVLQIYCLGRFYVRIGPQTIEHWRSVRAKSLFKYLLSQQGHTAPKDVLMEAIWPDCEPSLANNNLKAAVSALRETLDCDGHPSGRFAWVLFQDGNYRVNSGSDVWVDAEEFEYRWHAGRQLEREGKAAEALLEYKAAEVLYKGDYMEDNLYEEWTSLQREAIKDEYLFILRKLADYSMQEEDYEACNVYCKKILSKDICSEDAYRRLMFCHSRLGQRNRAIDWYRLCEKTIRKELDLSPHQQTMELYHKLLKQEYM